jgi:hypothetical protein
MNTQVNIKTRRSVFSPTFLTLLLGVVVMLVLGGSSVQAQTQNATITPLPEPAGVVDSSIAISAKGTVNDPNGAITVSGSVFVTCRRVVDTTSTATPQLVLLDFDFSKLSATSGSARTTLKSYTTGDNHASEIRPLQASDTIIVTSPYFETTKDGLTAKSWLVTATLSFDVASGKLTGGTISIGDNVVTKATVGTIAPAQ